MNETSIQNTTKYLSSDSEQQRSRVTFRLQLVAVADSGQEQVQEVARWERQGVQLETLGLTLSEGKLILKNIQESVIQQQVNESLTRQRCCPDCGRVRPCKGHHDVTFRTLFG